MSNKFKLIFLGIIFLVLPLFVRADIIGQTVKFYLDPSYDLTKREETSATLRLITSQLYFYIDDNWWNTLALDRQQKINEALNNLTNEFEGKIYPTLTSYFGSEWTPGIDNDKKITILIHPMQKDAGGYFNSADEYSKIQSPKSNQREMIYLNSDYIDKELSKGLLAHEFLHLITFNQKDKTYGVSEETWLNESRAEAAVTLLGYDDVYERSNFQIRVKSFLEKPFDSLTDWKNLSSDYGVVNIFTQYLIDQYGIGILTDSLFSDKIGIQSLNSALAKRGFREDFSQIFDNWAISVLINDCSQGDKYCYKNPNLKNLKVVPQLNFLPLTGESSLQFTSANYDWSANWYKIVGGKGKLILEFDGQDEGNFSVIYLICGLQEKCQIQTLPLNESQTGQIILNGFLNNNYQSLTIIPIIQTKTSDFDKVQTTYLFTWKVSAVEKTEEEKEAELKANLLAQIEFLKKEIAKLQAQIEVILGIKPQLSCQGFKDNLYYGLLNDDKVRCLQQFLKSQGPEIYPEGTISGNFLSLTQKALIRFQEKYKAEILTPLGLEKGTGFLGEMTRLKVNQLLSY